MDTKIEEKNGRIEVTVSFVVSTSSLQMAINLIEGVKQAIKENEPLPKPN